MLGRALEAFGDACDTYVIATKASNPMSETAIKCGFFKHAHYGDDWYQSATAEDGSCRSLPDPQVLSIYDNGGGDRGSPPRGLGRKGALCGYFIHGLVVVCYLPAHGASDEYDALTGRALCSSGCAAASLGEPEVIPVRRASQEFRGPFDPFLPSWRHLRPELLFWAGWRGWQPAGSCRLDFRSSRLRVRDKDRCRPECARA